MVIPDAVKQRSLVVPGLWTIHSYYTLCPYAPDGSGRRLASGVDLATGQGEVLILNSDGGVEDRFGQHPVDTDFYHTGFWQTWGPDSQSVYYQSGTLKQPRIVRRNLVSGSEVSLAGAMEGAPPFGEPILSGLLGMLYAAGYGTLAYRPDLAPVPFQHRTEHGLFSYTLDTGQSRLALSTAQVLDEHPDRDRLRKADREMKSRLGERDGLTLMLYCVRWNSDGSRLLFYFGNHCTVAERGEPRLAYVFTADRDLQQLHLAVDLSFGRKGVHWSWHPDGEHLIGYGPDPDTPGRRCLAQVRFDGEDYRRLSTHDSGGHPSICPSDPQVAVTDCGGQPGQVVLLDISRDEVIQQYRLPRRNREPEVKGRNPHRVCHHPVFDRDGRRLLVNTLPGDCAVLCEIDIGLAARKRPETPERNKGG